MYGERKAGKKNGGGKEMQGKGERMKERKRRKMREG